MKALNKLRAECIFLNIEIRARGRNWSYSYVMTEGRITAKEVGQQWEKQQKRIRMQAVLAECKGWGAKPWAKGEFAEERKKDADGMMNRQQLRQSCFPTACQHVVHPSLGIICWHSHMEDDKK